MMTANPMMTHSHHTRPSPLVEVVTHQVSTEGPALSMAQKKGLGAGVLLPAAQPQILPTHGYGPKRSRAHCHGAELQGTAYRPGTTRCGAAHTLTWPGAALEARVRIDVPRVLPEDMVTTQVTDPPPDPEGGRNTDVEFMTGDAGW